MQRQSIHFKHQSLLFKEDLLSHHGSKVRAAASSLFISTSATTFSWAITRSSLFRTTFDFSDLNHVRLCTLQSSRTQNPILAARKNRRRIGWERAAKTAVQYVAVIASNLKVLPEPLDVVIREVFGVGNGGGSGIWKGFGGGFEGWGRRRWRVKFGLFRLLGVCALMIMLSNRRKPETDLACGVLGLFLLGSLVWDCQKAMKGWVLGFCSCALIVILGLRSEHLHIRFKDLRVRSPFVKIARAKRR
ncbi:uncharacterized protein LOC122649252 [Telopea speciosissima]|uniref:uncharacterized protein LOC122649252 n=1 Tax=Telopea speciosissima TaxID=54955 RepID=UPI001CC5DDF6|nr:uncharacterized protein LOC122649252 [Telopea speciosissima]